MGSFEIAAIILDRRNYRDRDLLLSILSPERGLLRGIFRQARGGRAPRAGLAEVLSTVQAKCYQGPHAEMINFKEIEVEVSSFPLASDFRQASAAAVVAEALLAFCPPEEPAPLPYRLGRALLNGLLQSMQPECAIFYAQFWILRIGGLLPAIDVCSRCGEILESAPALDPSGGAVLCRACEPKATAFPDSRALSILRAYEQQSPGRSLPEPTPRLVSWMDQRIRTEVERPMKALDFFRGSC